jgi:hypothetical protein
MDVTFELLDPEKPTPLEANEETILSEVCGIERIFAVCTKVMPSRKKKLPSF